MDMPDSSRTVSSSHLSSSTTTVPPSKRKSVLTNAASAYEIENAVAGLFEAIGCPEKPPNLTREAVSERLIKSIGHVSRKPFQLFYERLSNKEDFVRTYEEIKSENINFVDQWVRLLVRIREDKEFHAFINSMGGGPFNNSLMNSFSSPSTSVRKQPIVTSLVDGDSFQSQKTPSRGNATLVRQQQPSSCVNNEMQSLSSHNNYNHANTPNIRTPRSTSTHRLANIANSSFQNVPMTPNDISRYVNDPGDSNGEFSDSPDAYFKTPKAQKPNSVMLQHSPSTVGNKSIPPYMSYNFRPCDWPQENDCFGTLGQNETVTVQRQEQLLLRDLLYVLFGIEGKYIRLKRNRESDNFSLKIDPTADKMHVITVSRILKIAYSYSRIISFVESKGYGLVHQALVAAIKAHLLDYYSKVSEMEEMLFRNDLFLQKMFYLLVPYTNTFSLLEDVVAKLKHRSFGGGVLTVLHEKARSIQGVDNEALQLGLKLTKAASEPYFEMLKQWIYYGEIDDARHEFFIEDTYGDDFNDDDDVKETVNVDEYDSEEEYSTDFGKFNEKYWDKRYRIKPSKTPIFLKEKQNIIFKTGKYVSIINKIKQLYVKTQKAALPQILQQASSQQQNAQQLQHLNNQPNIPFDIQSVRSGFFGDVAPSGLASLIHGPAPIPPSTNFFNSYQVTQSPYNPLGFDPTSGAMTSMMNPGFGNIGNIGCNSSSSSNSQISSSLFGGAVVFTPKPEEIVYSFDESTYITPIMSAYQEASGQLLHILINESQLIETLNAVKHYMFLAMGDFIVYFWKNASMYLCKRTDSVVQHRLDSMMGYALGISVAANDRQFLKDDIHVEFENKTFLKQIYKIMRPSDAMDSNSPSNSYFLRSEYDDDDDDDEDVGLNRSVIGSVIEATNQDFDSSFSSVNGQKMSISSQVRLRKQLYINSGTTKKSDQTDSKNHKNPLENDEDKKLFCYESLVLKFDVPFPLSLIFSEKTIFSYQLLFRYIFLCRYAALELEEAWKDNILHIKLKQSQQIARKAVLSSTTNLNKTENENTQTAEMLAKEFKIIHRKAFVLRNKMISFVRNFHYFFACEVIDPSFSQFTAQITKNGTSLDSVIEFHEKFLEQCFNKSFLTNMEITSIIIKIFTLCIELSHALKDSIDKDDHDSVMESSCFFGKGNNPYSVSRPPSPGSELSKGGNYGDDHDSKNFVIQLNEKLNKVFFSDRNFGKSVKNVKDIVHRADLHFDRLVMKLLKRIYSDNGEYHLMHPFVSRLDFNDFYRKKLPL